MIPKPRSLPVAYGHTLTADDIAQRSKDMDTMILAMRATGYVLFFNGAIAATSIDKDGCTRVADHLQYQYQGIKELSVLDMTACPITEED